MRPQFPDVLDCLSQSNYEPDLKRVCINSNRISGKTKSALTGHNNNKTMQKQKTKINMETYILLLLPNTVFEDITTMYASEKDSFVVFNTHLS